jgi:hypothetical protein
LAVRGFYLEEMMKRLIINVFQRLGLILACVVTMAFLAAALSDWVMGCGEGYHSAKGYVEPDNQGCFFSKEVHK